MTTQPAVIFDYNLPPCMTLQFYGNGWVHENVIGRTQNAIRPDQHIVAYFDLSAIARINQNTKIDRHPVSDSEQFGTEYLYAGHRTEAARFVQKALIKDIPPPAQKPTIRQQRNALLAKVEDLCSDSSEIFNYNQQASILVTKRGGLSKLRSIVVSKQHPGVGGKVVVATVNLVQKGKKALSQVKIIIADELVRDLGFEGIGRNLVVQLGLERRPRIRRRTILHGNAPAHHLLDHGQQVFDLDRLVPADDDVLVFVLRR